MLNKIVSVFSYAIIAGMLFFLFLMLFEPKSSGADPSTRGIGKTMIILAVVAIAFLVVFNLSTSSWIKYFGLCIGILCAIALLVMLLAMSGSSLIYQDTRQAYTPHYEDQTVAQLFDAFQKTKVKKWKTLLQSHPEHLQHPQLLQDILYDAYTDDKSNPLKLEALQYMLDAGTKIDSNCCKAFSQFTYSNKLDFTELLLQHGADPNCIAFPSKTVLLYTIDGYNKHEKMIELLKKYRVDLNAKTYNEQYQDMLTPLLYATYQGHWDCCMVLLKNGANPYYKNKDGLNIKEYILKLAINPDNLGYYKVPEFLELVQKIKAYE